MDLFNQEWKRKIVCWYPKPTEDSPNAYAPLSIIFPAAAFMEMGHHVEVFDGRFDSDELVLASVADADVLAVSAMTGVQCGEAARLMKIAKNENPHIHTLVGGYHPTLLPEEVMGESFVDEVFIGPLESKNLPLNSVTRPLFDRTQMMWMTSTGCPGRCTFCVDNLNLNGKWKPIPIEKLRADLTTLHSQLGFKHLTFADPNIGGNVKRMLMIGQILRDLGGVTFHCNIRNDYLKKEMVEALAWAGCTSIEVGCESGDEYVLRNIIRKGHGPETIIQTARNIKDYGQGQITVMYSFMARVPGETYQQITKTMDLIDEIHRIDSKARTSIYRYTPFPGALMFDMAVENGFAPPTDMKGWSKIGMGDDPLYWIAGLTFRKDNTAKNFPGEARERIRPYEELAEKYWRERKINDFPIQEVKALIREAVEKLNKGTVKDVRKCEKHDMFVEVQ